MGLAAPGRRRHGLLAAFGMVIVCDGTEAAAKRIARMPWNDPATGVMRRADAGYEIAVDCAKDKGLDLPGILG